MQFREVLVLTVKNVAADRPIPQPTFALGGLNVIVSSLLSGADQIGPGKKGIAGRCCRRIIATPLGSGLAWAARLDFQVGEEAVMRVHKKPHLTLGPAFG